jgi:hypothetical protein
VGLLEPHGRRDQGVRRNALMDEATRERLLEAARSVLAPRRLSKTVEVGGVGAALLTPSGAIYKGVCIDAASGIGF